MSCHNLEDQNETEEDNFEHEAHDGNGTVRSSIMKIKKINKALIFLFPTLNGIFYIVYFYVNLM